MKVYTKIVYDKDDNIIEEHSYDYNGPVSQAHKASFTKGGPVPYFIKKKKRINEATGEDNYQLYSKEHLDYVKKQLDIKDVGVTYKENAKNPNEETTKAGFWYENPLHKFASYNTIFTLSGISEEELHKQTYFTDTPHEIIARTGGIGEPNVNRNKYDKQVSELDSRAKAVHLTGEYRTKGSSYYDSMFFLESGRDIFFENVNILSTTGPNAERGLANFQKMEFQLHEPFGISLMERVRAAAFVNGYLDYMDAPYLLTIEWKGWDEQGKRIADSRLKRRIPIRIVRVEFDVDQGGARYQMIAVAAEGIAFDDRFKYPRTSINIPATTYVEWADELKKQLNEQMEEEKEEKLREHADEYDFHISPEVEQDAKALGIQGGIHMTKTSTTFTRQGGAGGPGYKGSRSKWIRNATVANTDIVIDENTSLVKLFEDVVRAGFGYGRLVENFWFEYGRLLLNKSGGASLNPSNAPSKQGSTTKILDYFNSKQFELDVEKEENQYVNWFMIKPKFEVITSRFDSIRKTHPKRITFVAVRQKIHILKFIRPGVSFGKINWSSYVRKKYNYMYTGENIDIQNLRINYKTAYYMRNTRPFFESENQKAEWRAKIDFLSRINEVFGQEDYPEEILQLKMEPSIRLGKSTVKVNDPRSQKNQEFYDYLTNPQVDMMRIELEILGDPAFICQDQFTNLRGKSQKYGNQGPWNHKESSFNAESYQPLILLNYKLPNDLNDRAGYFFTDDRLKNRSMWFAGVYQVVKIESKIEQGSFTQVLHCVRMNNQQGKGSKATMRVGKILTKHFNKQNISGKKYGLYDQIKDTIDNTVISIKNKVIEKATDNKGISKLWYDEDKEE